MANIGENRVVYCANEDEYYNAIDSAGTRLVVVDCFAEWCVRTVLYERRK